MKSHHYNITLNWTGNQGKGTQGYTTYSRDHELIAAGKTSPILGSSDPAFRGDKTKYNPEDLFLSALASCHMLWYLHLCSQNNIVVTKYTDKAQGVMEEQNNGSGKFTLVTLYPEVTITSTANLEKAKALHEEANKMCFIANSCNFKIAHKPVITV